jgi:CheY-like chemotaxis protein
LTAFVGDEDREESMVAGFQVHLGKPVDAAALIAAVSRLAPQGARSAAS